MQPFLIFSAQFGLVFLLGFQSLCVRDGRVLAANVNSFLIGWCSLLITPAIADADLIRNDPATLVAFLLGGMLGISAAMLIHSRTLATSRRSSTPHERNSKR